MNDTQQADPAVLEQMQNKLTGYIEKKRASSYQIITSIEDDCRLIYDYLVPANKILFHFNGEPIEKPEMPVEMVFEDENGKNKYLTLHDNSIVQLGQKLNIPTKYLKDLVHGTHDSDNQDEYWQKELASRILTNHVINSRKERYLIRAVGNEARGVLSDSFKRMNSIKLYSTFLHAANNSGCVVTGAWYDGLTGFVEVLRPDVITIPTENNGIQYICFGVQFRNSDFGVSSLEMRAFNFVIKCENGWISQSVLRNVHLGARLPDNLQLSEETYRLDTETKASLVNDTIGQIINPEKIYEYSVKVQEASKIQINIENEVKNLNNLNVLDHETESIKKLLMENDPNNNIQGANTLFKLTQALSAVSRDSTESRKRELDEITGKLFDRVKVNQ